MPFVESRALPTDEDQDLQEPIAVCGLALKFPQDACSEEGFWTMIQEKRSAMTEFPPERLNINAFHDSTRYDSLRTRGAHFIQEDVALFDVDFFSITPSEAAAMDPMQRILLETTFHAFESAGIRIEDAKGSRSSVHTGCFSNDYLQLMLKDSERLPPYAAVGASQSMLANRLSWFYDLRGPSVNLDSACSSSAMAVDLSCQLLRSGTTNMGVVAGCNLLLDPDYSTILSNMQMLSPTGLSYAFDQRANGYSRGEGVAVVILKRLSDALRDNDTVRALIRASGTNQDGRTPGITQPDANSQADLIRETYMRAGLSMRHTRLFEAHGTGTEVGDPAEISAIADCFHTDRNTRDPLHVGSVKTNIGHLEGASGIAGLIKAILAVESGVIPPNTNFESINRRLASYSYVISLPLECKTWPLCEIRRASINSFGYGGTNCHIVIDDVDSYLFRKGLIGKHRTTVVSRTSSRHCMEISSMCEYPKLLVWSGSTQSATRAMLSKWQEYFSKHSKSRDNSWLSDVAYTLDSRRKVETIEQLASTPTEDHHQHPKVAFIFSGQGAQWYAMGRELFLYPIFANGIQESESILSNFGCSWSIKDELLKSENDSMIDKPSIAQCLTTVVQIGLVDLFRSFNINPVAVVGHSMGEISAAYCADLLTRECALRLAYYRGLFTTKVQDQCTFIGAMLAVGLSAENAAKYFNKVDSGFTILPDGLRLTISCINSPRSTTVSGEISQIQGLKRVLDHEGIFNRQLRVPVAYHSRQMELIASDCLEKIGHLQSPKQTGSAKMISSVTGELLTKERACEGSYWVANLVSPVLFSKAMERLCRDSVRTPRKKLNGSHRDVFGIDHIIEIGPHAALRLPIQEILETHSRKDEIRYFSALYRRKSASISLLSVLGELHCRGLSVDLRIINDPDLLLRDSRKSLIDAPKYPFDHSIRYWSESPLIRNYRTRAHGYTELLGSPSRDWNPLEPQWRCCVQTADMPWLLEHKLSGRAIYPASAFIVMAMQGVAQIKKDKQRISGFTLRDVRYDSSIEVSLGCKDLETRLQLRPADWTIKTKNSPWTFTVFSVTAGNWKESCHGTIEAHFEAGSTTTSEVERSEKHRDCAQERNNRCNMQFDASVVYQNFAKCGFQYGPMFQGITKVCHDGADTVTADVILQSFHKNPYSSDLFLIHPATLDSFFQVALVALSQGDKCIPTQAISGIEKLWLSATNLQSAHQNIKASARVDVDTPRHKRYSGFALCHGGENIRIVLDGLKTTVVSSAQQTERLPNDCQFWYKIQTNVDIETLSRSQILRRFDSMCGSDPSGPSGFFHDLRLYLRAMIGDLHGQFQNMDPDLSKPHLMRYIGWMKWHLDNSTLEPCSLSDGTLRSRVADQGFLGQFFLKVADSAFDVLKGKADMMQLLFEDNLVETFYEQQLAESVYYRKCQQYLEDLSFKYPSMDYLEIGAGTGSFTEHILKALSSSTTGAEERFNSYCFTDISTAFFERARQRFSAHTHKMKFTVLDADRDPVFQRFREHSFDVVCASNVLHVTKNLDLTLQRIRKLLKTGGKIILHEYIRPENIEVGFVFGLLPGWWPPTDGSRTMSPLITETSWDVLLRRNGFSGIDFALRDFADEDSHLMSFMFATATEFVPLASLPEVTIAIDHDSGHQKQLASVLAEALYSAGYQNIRIVSLRKFREYHARLEAVVALFDIENAILSRIDDTTYQSLKCLLLSSSKVLWVSKGGYPQADPSHGMIDGFAKVFRIENINVKFTTLRLEEISENMLQNLSLITSALKYLIDAGELDSPEDYIVKDGMLHVSRIYEDLTLKAKITEMSSGERKVVKRLGNTRPFTLTTKDWANPRIESITDGVSVLETLADDEVEIEVQAIGLHSVDSSIMSGNISTLSMGRECAGFVTKIGKQCPFILGDRVCAYSNTTANSTCRTKGRFAIRITRSLSFEEASTLPQDYLVANYLVREARLGDEDVVVIRGGQTRIGRALLYILGASSSKIFATVATKEEETLIRTVFTHVQFSTDCCFSEKFYEWSNTGANVMFDVMYTNPKQLTECVYKFGQVFSVRTGTEVTGGEPLSLRGINVSAGIAMTIVDIKEVLEYRLDELQMPLAVLHEHHAFPVKVVPLSNLKSMATYGRDLDSRERLSVTYDDQDEISVYESCTRGQLFDAASSYVIAGGLGDLGRCVAKWMVNRGARSLILLSRSGPRTDTAKRMIKDLEELGAKVRAPLCDIADRASLEFAIQQCYDMPAIKGCIQASGALKDIMYSNMSFHDWKVPVDPKVRGSWNLHELLPKGMDFFILTSSIAGIIGQATQINYATANTYQDAMARYRLSIGEKAVSLDLGILSTGGLLTKNKGLSERLALENVYMPLSELEIVALFEQFCDPHLAANELPAQVVSGIIHPSLQNSEAPAFPVAFAHPFWSQTRVQTGSTSKSNSEAFDVADARTSLVQASSPAEMSEIVASALTDQFCCLTLIPKVKVNLDEPLHSAGADSLSAIYLRNWIAKQFRVDIAVFDILGDVSINMLGNTIAREWCSIQGIDFR